MTVVALVLGLIGFLLGFIPEFRTASGLRDELRVRDQRIQQFEREAKLLRARVSASLVYLELTRRNYGIAAQQATDMFDQLRGLTSDASPQTRPILEKVLSQKDALTTGIAKSDPEAAGLAQQMSDQLQQVTGP